MSEQTIETTQSADNTKQPSLFSNGAFVILLIVIALLIALIAWSVSLVSMIFGAIGALISTIALNVMNTNNLRFDAAGSCSSCKLSDENWFFIAFRAILGMVFGLGLTLITVGIEANWPHLAIISLFGGLLFDRLVFRK